MTTFEARYWSWSKLINLGVCVCKQSDRDNIWYEHNVHAGNVEWQQFTETEAAIIPVGEDATVCVWVSAGGGGGGGGG